MRTSDQPRYNLEMALLRLMHLRKLTPLADLLAQSDRGQAPPRPAAAPAARVAPPANLRAAAGAPTASPAPVTRTAPSAPSAPSPASAPSAASASSAASAPGAPTAASPGSLKDAFLAQVKAAKVYFYNTVVAQAYRVEVAPARITFTFLPNQRVPKQQCEDARSWLESIAEKVAGKRIPVAVTVADGGNWRQAAAPAAPPTDPRDRRGAARGRFERPGRAGAPRDLPGRENQSRRDLREQPLGNLTPDTGQRP